MSAGLASLGLLPNPLTPMAFLPPDVARQVTISYYMLVSGLVVMIWDILNNILADIKLAKHGFSLPLVAYFASRISMLAYQISLVITNTAPIGDCRVATRLLWLYPVQMSFTAMLFFFRVRAMYSDSKRATSFFLFMWLAVTGASITEDLLPTVQLGPTAYCIGKEVPPYIVVSCILPLVNDTLIFFAITLKLAGTPRWKSNSEDSLLQPNWIRTVLFGEYLPTFSKAMLRDGQAYYLSAVLIYLSFLIIFFIKAIPEPIRWSIGPPSVVVVNIMACRVYRNTKSGIYLESMDTVSLPTIQCAKPSERSRTSTTPSQPIVLGRFDREESLEGDIEANHEKKDQDV